MSTRVIWDRRSRSNQLQPVLTTNAVANNDLAFERRQLVDNDYQLIIGNTGLDRFELFVIAPIITVISTIMLVNFVSGL